MALNKGFNDEIKALSQEPIQGVPANETYDLVLARQGKVANTPCRMHASATPDSKLNFEASATTTGNGSLKTIPPIDDSITQSVAGTIDYQNTSSPVTGITLTLQGQTYAHPIATSSNRYMVGVFVRKANGSFDCKYSDIFASLPTVQAIDVGTLFSALDGLPVGYIYLQSTDNTGKWKTVGSTTSIIEDAPAGTAQIYNFGAGGGAGGGSDRTFKITAFSATGCTIKGGTGGIDDGRAIATYDGSGGASTDYGQDLTVSLNTVLTNSSLATIGTLNLSVPKLLALVVDLTTLSAQVSYSDFLRKVYGFQEANLKLIDQTDLTQIDPRRYVLLNQIYLPVTVSSWATCTAFVKPSRIHDSMAAYFPYLERYTSPQQTTVSSSLALNHGLSAEPQMVQVYYFDGSKKIDITKDALVDKTATQVKIATLGLTFGGSQYVYVEAHYIPTIPNIAASQRQFRSAWFTDALTTTVAHGLSDMDDIVGYQVQEWNTSSGKRRTIDGSALVINFDDTNFYLNWTGLSPSATLKYRVVAGGSPLPWSIPNGTFDNIYASDGASAPNFPAGATGISTGINGSPVVKKLTKQTISSVGTAGQVAAGHVLSVKSYPTALTAANVSYYNLAGLTDASGNGRTLTDHATVPYTGNGILGGSNAAAVLNGTTQYLTSTDALFNPANGTAFAFHAWVKPSTVAGTGMIFGGVRTNANAQNYMLKRVGTALSFWDSTSGGAVYSLPGVFATGVYAAVGFRIDTAGVVTFFVNGKIAGIYSGYVGSAVSSFGMCLGANTVNSTTADFFAGEVDEVFFAQGAMADADMRKLASYRWDHNSGVSLTNQRWSINLYGASINDSNNTGWMIDKYDINSLFFDLSDRAATDQVELFMEDLSASPTTVGSVVPFDQIYSANPSFPVAHGQSGVPEIVAQGEVSSGVWEPIDLKGNVNADSSNLTGSLAAFFTAGYLRVRVVARNVGPVQTGVPVATGTISGLMGTSANGTQPLTGLKIFQGGAAVVGNIRTAEGSGTTALSNDDKRQQTFNLTAARTVQLPSTSVLAGDEWVLENLTTFQLTVQPSGGGTIDIIAKGRIVLRALQDAPTATSHWNVKDYYSEDAVTMATTTFQGNAGGAASASIAIAVMRVGKIVTVDIPQLTTVVPTTGSVSLNGNVALPSWARPTTTKSFYMPSYNNGAFVASPIGDLDIGADGSLKFYRDNVGATAYTNSVAAGFARIVATFPLT